MPSFTRMLRQNGRIIGHVKDNVAFLNNNPKPEIPERDTRAGNIGPVDDICENDFPDTESPTAELLRLSQSPSTVEVLQTLLDELGKKLRERKAAINALGEARETLDGVVWTIAPYDYAMFMAGQEVPPEEEEWHGICPRARRQAHEWLYQRGRVTSRIDRFGQEVEELQRNITAVFAAMRQADDIQNICRRASMGPAELPLWKIPLVEKAHEIRQRQSDHENILKGRGEHQVCIDGEWIRMGMTRRDNRERSVNYEARGSQGQWGRRSGTCRNDQND